MKLQLSVVLALLAAIPACKKNDSKPDVAKLLLTEVKVDRGQNPQPAFQIDYDKDKPVQLREFSRNANLTVFSDFSFNSKGVITSFVKRTENAQGGLLFLQHKIRFDGDKLFDVQVTDNLNTADPKVVNQFLFNSDDGLVVFVRDEANKNIRERRANYDNAGNIIRIIAGGLPAGTPDTIDFSNYDNNLNSIALIDGITGKNDFLPSSKNNPGRMIQRIKGREPVTQEFTYEYNQRGLPVKIINDRQTILLEYKKAD
jgi:hypothetical protein